MNRQFWYCILGILSLAVTVSYGNEDHFDVLEVPLHCRAWQNFGEDFDTFPEAKYLKDKSNTGIAFSGGGTRSYAATLGYLRGLLELGLLDRVKYLSAVSGGSWAATSYTFNQLSTDGDVRRFLGAITPPERVNWLSLLLTPRDCARSFPVHQNLILKSLWLLLQDEDTISDTWFDAISSTFLEPAGIGRDALYSWNQETWLDMLKRNPSLEKTAADNGLVLPCGGVSPCKNRPYLIINTAMLGPWKDAPFSIRNRTFTMLEWTPLYMGFGKTLNITYLPFKEKRVLGGYIEPIGFGGGTSKTSTSVDSIGQGPSHSSPHVTRVGKPETTLQRRLRGQQVRNGTDDPPNAYLNVRSLLPNQTEGYVQVTPAPAYYTLANATGASSWAPGSLFADTPFLELLDEYVGLKVDYKSPALLEKFERTETSTMLLSDAGALENQGLMSLLRRRLDRIVVFVNTPTPLKPRSMFNPFKKHPGASDIDGSIACYFGVHVPSTTVQTLGADFTRNQVFEKSRFPELVTKMQQAQSRGKGIVVKMDLETIKNSWWGIPAGLKVQVTWVYLGRVREWESRLPKDFFNHVYPKKHGSDPSRLPTHGAFARFPHFETSDVQLTAPQTNLLSDLAGWVVLENAQLFRDALE